MGRLIGFDISKKNIAGNAFGGLIIQFLIRFKGIFILPLVIHFLTKETIGDWRLVNTTVSLLLPIVTLNLLDGSGMYFSSDFNQKSVSNKFSTIVQSSFLIFALTLLPLYFLLQWYELTSNVALVVIAYLVSSYIFKVSIFMHQAYQKTKVLLFVSFVVEYASAFITIFLLYNGEGSVNVLVLPVALLNFIVSLILLTQVQREILFMFLHVDFDFLKRSLRTSIPLIPVFFSEWIISFISIYFIGLYLDKEQLGNFSVAISIATLVLILKSTLQYFWYSTCSRLLVNKQYEEFDNVYSWVYKTYIVIVLVSMLFYLFFTSDLILLLANNSYFIIKNTAIIICFGYCMLIVSSMANGILYAIGKTRGIMWAYLLSAVVVVISSFILIPSIGLLGAAIGSCIGNACLLVAMHYLVSRVYRMPSIPRLFRLLKIFLLLLIGSIAVLLAEPSQTVIRIVGVVVIAGFLTIAFKYRFIPFSVVKKINLRRLKWT